jgi:DNA (cytosine-5)-methyltransferase 1
VCSGIEAASVAWRPLGWKAVGFAEIDKFPSRVLAHHYPDVPNFGDFTAIDVSTLGPVDILVGGTPCQSFSVAGRGLSLADARGNLTLAYAVLAHELARSNELRNAVWENVPGIFSKSDNPFGWFLGALVGHSGAIPKPRWRSWPNSGMVDGPWGRCAWRVFDAQYFGLAQRRARVFVVADFGNGADPAAILFERKSLRGHSPPRREAAEGVAGSLTASPGGSDENDAVDGRLITYGGNNTTGPINIAAALNACSSPSGRQDFETETFVVAPPLTSNPYGDHESREGLLVTHSLRGEGFDASEDGTGRGVPIIPICFDETQITSVENRCNPQPGDPAHPLAAGARPPSIVFEEPFTPAIRGRVDTHNLEYRQDGLANAVFTPNGGRAGIGVSAIDSRWVVRRLTPMECEILQGFPPNYTNIPGAADGSRYKALGNSMAVPVMRWIGERIVATLNDAAEAL